MKLKIYADGGARNNPGPAGVGIVIYDENGKELEEISRYLGERTNNQAEYEAVITALEKSLKYKPEHIDLFLDSLLIINQLQGQFKVKNHGLKSLHQKAVDLVLKFKKVNFNSIPREKNKLADKLVNKAIDLKSA